MDRKKFIARSGLTLLGLGVSGGMYTWQVEPFWLEFVQQKMPVKNLPDEFVGKSLMQISDIHVGNRFDYQFIINSFQKAQSLNPDFVVYTGDYVSYENEKQFNQLEEVLRYAVKGNLGTVGILGNHDYGRNWAQQEVADTITHQLQRNGITVLNNLSTSIQGLHIHGLDDYWGLNFDPQPTLQNINPDKANLVLCHNPDVCDLDIWGEYSGWILSGHTHGGQCKPPFLPPPMLPVKNKNYSSGQIALSNGRTLYINRALGHLWQVRFNVCPEITVFTLQQA